MSPSVFDSGGGRAQEYAAWADRLKQKRARAQEAIRSREASSEPGASGADGPTTGGTDWSAEALFAESRQVAEDELQLGSTPEALRDLLGVFRLAPGATLDQVTEVHRSLAKLHHPDRYVDADPQVQTHHAEQMAQINAAYETLRRRLG